MAEPPLDPTAFVRHQAIAAARTLLRPGTYLGAVREVSWGLFHATTYPLGVLPTLDTVSGLRGLRRAGAGHATPGDAHPDDRVAEQTPALADVTTDAATAAAPVILVHGYFHNRSAFLVMARALKRAGFQDVHSFSYRPLDDLPAAAELLAGEVDRILQASGAQRCQLVGHSMGGIIARHYVQELGGHETVDTVVTLGTPHRGTYTSYLGLGKAATQLRPGSPFLRRLEETARPTPVRYIAYYSELDVTILPTSSAKLVHPALHAVNIRLRDTGHLSLLLSGEVLRGVVAHLADRDADRHEPSPAM